ncbi:hypothetical protein [Chryseobacterium sp.]|uniref:hypothetical protein n=1 Tax=Chryseobacterium sp. TaxID=1871047 RepID=UPI0026171E26|nr:hypothetical protein [Chryseobacterium sp.]
MKKIYNGLSGKTKKEILETIKENLNCEIHSDEWFLYLGKSYPWQRKYQYLLFDDNIVIRSSIVFKNLWDKSYFRNFFSAVRAQNFPE